ncbi:MAG: hypothetical protein ACRDBL_09535 [Rhabdaerophilum sp.]
MHTIETEHTRTARASIAEQTERMNAALAALDLSTDDGRASACILRGQLALLPAVISFMCAERELGTDPELIFQCGAHVIGNATSSLIGSMVDSSTRTGGSIQAMNIIAGVLRHAIESDGSGTVNYDYEPTEGRA